MHFSFIIPPCKTKKRQESFFSHTATTCSKEEKFEDIKGVIRRQTMQWPKEKKNHDLQNTT
jgi:hypothetical protein